MKFLPLRAWTLVQKHCAPFADDPLGVLLGPAKTKATHNAWSTIADGRQSEEDVLWVELFHFLQRLRDGVLFLHVAQRLAQKILHSRFAVQLINIRLKPLFLCPIKVRHVRQENCVPGQKPGHRSARNLLGKIPVVPTSVCGNGDSDDQQQNSSHKGRLSGADARYSMLHT
jgi:hypothetical protein